MSNLIGIVSSVLICVVLAAAVLLLEWIVYRDEKPPKKEEWEEVASKTTITPTPGGYVQTTKSIERKVPSRSCSRRG